MDNYFISKPPYGRNYKKNGLINFVNKCSRYFKFGYSVVVSDSQKDMNTIEQRINYYHLLDAILVHNVEGEIIELGCFTGQCAMLFQNVLQQRYSKKQLYLFDSFEIKFSETGSIEEKLIENFKKNKLKLPILVKGFFQDTLSEKLPSKIAFAHIDCGFGGNPEEHKTILLFCLNEVYKKMSNNAICVLMDYFDENINGERNNHNPGVKLACDEFFIDKSEEIVSLYGNQYSHAYFRKIAN
ncbi:TylF/MycF/NovP-related O-methyltransferase [Pedobacter sp.]|uniref:TylF/MycF/NovP-related O-methyltransferase n=1 Tax=Pedobacter sp. TaxID=1411316 RepID=UPI003BAB0D89